MSIYNFAAINLLENYNVKAIIGPQKSSQAIFISKLGNISHVPVISFTATNPSLSSGSLVDVLHEADARIPLASLFFIQAKEVGMMNKGHAWIMTDGVTNLIDSLNPSVLESLNGALGVEFYVPKSRELDDFTMRWNMRFQIENPTDPPLKLSIFGLWGYDTIWAVAQASAKVEHANTTFQKLGVDRNSTSLETLETSSNGPELLQAILANFRGLFILTGVASTSSILIAL